MVPLDGEMVTKDHKAEFKSHAGSVQHSVSPSGQPDVAGDIQVARTGHPLSTTELY